MVYCGGWLITSVYIRLRRGLRARASHSSCTPPMRRDLAVFAAADVTAPGMRARMLISMLVVQAAYFLLYSKKKSRVVSTYYVRIISKIVGQVDDHEKAARGFTCRAAPRRPRARRMFRAHRRRAWSTSWQQGRLPISDFLFLFLACPL